MNEKDKAWEDFCKCNYRLLFSSFFLGRELFKVYMRILSIIKFFIQCPKIISKILLFIRKVPHGKRSPKLEVNDLNRLPQTVLSPAYENYHTHTNTHTTDKYVYFDVNTR